jgi:hypothetical protein
MTMGAGRRAALLSLAVLVLDGCAGMRTHHNPPEAPPAANSTTETPPETQPPPETPADETTESHPPDTAATPPACTCMEAKTKPKPRPRPKPVHKESPPQLPTAPVVEETPKGGLVDAQVKPMPVSVMSILGKRVKGANGEDLGRVVDVLADASGRVRIAIIDFGGFLGVGNHRIAVEWPLLRFSPDGSDPSLLLSLSPEKLKTAPEYKDNPRPQTLMDPTAIAPATAPAPAPAPAPAAETKK